jgi:hypothetical protein
MDKGPEPQLSSALCRSQLGDWPAFPSLGFSLPRLVVGVHKEGGQHTQTETQRTHASGQQDQGCHETFSKFLNSEPQFPSPSTIGSVRAMETNLMGGFHLLTCN